MFQFPNRTPKKSLALHQKTVTRKRCTNCWWALQCVDYPPPDNLSLIGMACRLFALCFQCAEIHHPRCQDRGVTRVPLQRLSVVRVWTHQVWHPLLLWAWGGRKVQSPSWGTVYRCQETCLFSQHSLLDFWHKVQIQCIFSCGRIATWIKLLLMFI